MSLMFVKLVFTCIYTCADRTGTERRDARAQGEGKPWAQDNPWGEKIMHRMEMCTQTLLNAQERTEEVFQGCFCTTDEASRCFHQLARTGRLGST